MRSADRDGDIDPARELAGDDPADGATREHHVDRVLAHEPGEHVLGEHPVA
jgi:hypothetical protein